ncbi:MAG: fructose-bisphosphate aldolase [Deltaproteobacteria bacterium]|nr:fructose-bisphosphate aldolase [Deltaproteobacteria bacterium]
MLGKKVRLERVMDRNTKKTVIIPLIHGVGMGPIEGIKDIRNCVDTMALGGANAVILHKGIVSSAHRRSGKDIGLIIHLTATSKDHRQTLVTEVEEAVRMGADAVSVRISIGGEDEPGMLDVLGLVARDAAYWGMPLFALMDPGEEKDLQKQILGVMRAARIGAELGADVVRVPYTGDAESFAEVVSVCPVPVVAIGGEKKVRDRDILDLIHGVMSAGAYGVSMGRNVFQYDKPGNMIKAISLMVHRGVGPDVAAKSLEEAAIQGATFGTGVIW